MRRPRARTSIPILKIMLQLYGKVFITTGEKRLYGTTEASLTEYSVLLRGIFNSKGHEYLSCKIVITISIVYLHNGKYWLKNAR